MKLKFIINLLSNAVIAADLLNKILSYIKDGKETVESTLERKTDTDSNKKENNDEISLKELYDKFELQLDTLKTKPKKVNEIIEGGNN